MFEELLGKKLEDLRLVKVDDGQVYLLVKVDDGEGRVVKVDWDDVNEEIVLEKQLRVDDF